MPILDRIRSEVEGHPIVLFMKGTPQFPMCGFSSRVVQALKACKAAVPLDQRAGRPGGPRQPAALLELADLPAAVHPWRTDRRLRHHGRAAREGRAGPDGRRRLKAA
jgi:hypothetical protein